MHTRVFCTASQLDLPPLKAFDAKADVVVLQGTVKLLSIVLFILHIRHEISLQYWTFALRSFLIILLCASYNGHDDFFAAVCVRVCSPPSAYRVVLCMMRSWKLCALT
jgi:hypothetical protein